MRLMGFRRTGLVRRSAVAVFVLCGALGAAPASAQTVIVRHVPPGSTFELVLDAKEVGTAKANASGNATVTANSVDGQMDVNVWLDVCDDVHRVILVRPGAPLPAGACRRTQIAGLYLLQRTTSIVIDTNSTASLLIRQGRVYDSWLTDSRSPVTRPVAGLGPGSSAEEPVASEPLPPLTGLTLFGGAGLGSPQDFRSQACGTVGCSENSPLQYGGGIGWWFNDFLGVEGRYGYLGKLTAVSAGSDPQFSTTREGGFLAVAGRAGLRKGRFRPFGRAGLSLGRATLTTTQTIGDGTQTLQMRARGWAPVFGGGVEIWLSPRLGLFADGQRLGLKGKDEGDSGATMNDTLLTAQVGLAVRFP